MPIRDGSHERRLSELETRLVAAEQELRTVRQSYASSPAPRERWLGRTTSLTPSSYPTEGDTFEVELYSAYFDPTPGTQTITEVGRGRTVVARTRPAKYLARDTEVEVWRSRGHGALGVGEWWIGTQEGVSTQRLFSGATNYGRDYANVSRSNYGVGGGSNLRLFGGFGEYPTPSVPGQYLLDGLPTSQLAPTLTAVRDGVYLVQTDLVWEFPSLAIYDHRLLHDSLLGFVSAFSPTGTWVTASSPAYQYFPHIPWAAGVVTTLDMAASSGNRVRSYSRLPVSAERTGVTPNNRICHAAASGVFVLAAGDTVTIDLSAAYDFAVPSGFGAYEARLGIFGASLLWIA